MKIKKELLLPGFALFFMFAMFGCDPSTSSRPDLVISDLSLDGNNRLVVSIKNEGYGPVVADTGTLSIAIDGKAIGSYSLANLSDKSYKNLNGTTTISTNFKLSGSNRRVSAFIDAGNVIAETNEFQNVKSITFNPPAKNGPDFTISQLARTPAGQLRITVRNVGNAASSPNFPVKIRVIINETVAADLSPNLPSLAPNASTVISPSPAIAIAGLKSVRALLNTAHFNDEIDNTNGILEKWLGGNPSLVPYQNLLAIPKIANSIVWQDASGNHSYNSWTPGQKASLNAAILSIENNENPSLSTPPNLLAGDRISIGDAWTIFLAHIAQSLWVDVHNKVSWKLDSYSASNLALLLDNRHLTSYSAAHNAYRFDVSNLGRLTAWNPRICYDFLDNLRLINSSAQTTLYKVSDWMRGHLIHISGGADLVAQYGYAGPPPADKVLYPLEGKRHITAGCWGTTGLYNALLRSINIPVESGRMNLGGGNHSRPIFTTLDKSLPHGDDLYTRTLLPSGVPIPSSKLFYSLAQMNSKFIHPVPDCVGGNCNTVGEQAAFNRGKDHKKLAYDLRGDGILESYAKHGAAYMDDYFKGEFRGGVVDIAAKPFFEAAERATMISEIEKRLKEIGGGDLEAGKTIILARTARWSANN
ncbi:MAG TPA: hypothetical protein ENJ82_17240 [Bacteroidetes bacterium]|nr:hypothetical protein [Bacteroidota bacterium]